LADLDTELEKFAVGPRRAPERVCYAHLPNQFTNFSMYQWSSGSRAPAPKEAEALSVPLNHRCWLDQHHRLQTAWPQSVEQDPEQAVDREQPEPTRPLAVKNMQLVTEREVL
jgi:hypothetical protein